MSAEAVARYLGVINGALRAPPKVSRYRLSRTLSLSRSFVHKLFTKYFSCHAIAREKLLKQTQMHDAATANPLCRRVVYVHKAPQAAQGGDKRKKGE